MNTTVLGLGAGGSHPANIQIVDRVNIVAASVTIPAGFFGGSVNNQIGPRYTLMLAASGYPVYVGALWYVLPGHICIGGVYQQESTIGGSIKVQDWDLRILLASGTASPPGSSTLSLVRSCSVKLIWQEQAENGRLHRL